MTTWDDYLTEQDELESATSGLASSISEDLHDQERELANAEMDAILAGDVEAAESLHAQWKATEDAADHADWGEQELEWASQSAAEAEADATDAAEAASMDLPDSAAQIAGMAGIAGQASAAAQDEAMYEYEQASAAMYDADAADASTAADEPYVPYDADPVTDAAYDDGDGDDI